MINAPQKSLNQQQNRLSSVLKLNGVSSKQTGAKQSQVISLSSLKRAISQSAYGSGAPNAGVEDIPHDKLNIVFVSAEVAPYSKTGGLGDVVGGLPVEMAKRGHKCMTIAPRYDQYSKSWDTSVTININGEEVRFFHAIEEGVDRVFIDHEWFLAKVWGKTGAKLYGPQSGTDYNDNQKRFSLFCQAAIEACRVLPFGPGEDVTFVANDWHSAIVPVMIKHVYQPRGEFKNARVATCIHNIAFQGRFWPESYEQTGLPQELQNLFAFTDGNPVVFDESSPESDANAKPTGKSYEKINWLKAGLLSSNKVLTVSPNYAKEISGDEALGVEMSKYINAAGGIEGIVNGMDIKDWNPATDKFLEVNYNQTNVFEGKAANKEALQAEMGLPVDPSAPVFGFVGRLEEQKGVDILLEALPKALDNGKMQVVILGTGKASLQNQLKQIGVKHPGQAKGVAEFSAPLAHKIYAGCDFIVVPSRFEPCGLIQMQAMQYGAVPLVASTGGLVDTVKEGVTGFQMGRMDPDKCLAKDVDTVASTMVKASAVHGTPAFNEMVQNCIGQDLSWKQPAKKWEAILENMYKGNADSMGKKESVAVPIDAGEVAGKSA